MLLPGGLWDGQQRRREFAFGQVTGEFELTLAEIAGSDAPLPRQVTVVLAGALAHVGQVRAAAEVVHGLAIGDRQFLMRQLARVLGCDTLWIAPTCEACRRPFDVQIEQSRLPVKEAGAAFPFTIVQTSWGECRLRVPTGADQEATTAIPDDRAAIRVLARSCALDPIPEAAGDLSDADIARIEQGLEGAAPEVTTIAESACPECGHTNRVYVDPYACLTTGSDAVWDEIHEIASCYHWSERDIVGLSRERRRTYLRRIAGTHGTTGRWARDGSEG